MSAPAGRDFVLERSQRFPSRVDEVFRFFSDPHNLAQITPPWLHFHVVASSTATIEAGTVIDYRLRLRGVPVRWRSRISVWEPPHRFVDEQVRGPYRRWNHEHSFESLGSETQARDFVRYSVLGGALVDRWLVRPDLERLFEYRAEQLARILGG